MLTTFFGIPPAFLTDDTAFDQLDARLELLAAMRDTGIRSIGHPRGVPAPLPPETCRAIAAIIRRLPDRERESREATSALSGAPIPPEASIRGGAGLDPAASRPSPPARWRRFRRIFIQERRGERTDS